MTSAELTDLERATIRVDAFLAAVAISHGNGNGRTPETPMQIYSNIVGPLGEIALERATTAIINTND